MLSGKKIVLALVAVLAAALVAEGYERELNSRSLRDAFFLGKDTTFRSTDFFKDYARTFPVPRQGVHIERIEIVTPFKEMVDRARRAPDGYNPVQAEADYKRQAPPLTVKVSLQLTPSFPAHTPYTYPVFIGPLYLRDPNFWQEFEYHLVQGGEIVPQRVKGEPQYSCPTDGSCWLAGALVTLEYDPEEVASRPARVIVVTPDDQKLEAEFDLSRLR